MILALPNVQCPIKEWNGGRKDQTLLYMKYSNIYHSFFSSTNLNLQYRNDNLILNFRDANRHVSDYPLAAAILDKKWGNEWSIYSRKHYLQVPSTSLANYFFIVDVTWPNGSVQTGSLYPSPSWSS